jgi:hypothetical protein
MSVHCVYVFMHAGMYVCMYVCNICVYLYTFECHKTTMSPAGFQPVLPERAAVDPPIRPRGDWDRSYCQCTAEVPA